MDKKRITLWERYLTNEIGIEFKACLYFFAILFFYCVYRMIGGVFDASILHMAEMIFTCYGIGYLQVYVLWNFDEAEKLGGRELVGMIICTIIYGAISYIGAWFDKNILPTVILMIYILFTYLCVYLIYKTKRQIDDKKLNDDLMLFKTNHKSE